MRNMANSLVLLGNITGPHGIKGEVKIRTYTEAPENITAYGPLTDKSGEKTFKITIVRISGDHVIARIDGITDRSAAEKLRKQDLYLSRTCLPTTAEDEYYIEDLIGLEVRLENNEVFGKIESIQDYGAGTLVEVLTQEKKRILCPLSNETFRIYLKEGYVTFYPLQEL